MIQITLRNELQVLRVILIIILLSHVFKYRSDTTLQASNDLPLSSTSSNVRSSRSWYLVVKGHDVIEQA